MGKQTALLLADRGYQVFAGARSEEKALALRQDAEALGLTLQTLMLDVQSESSVNDAVAEVIEKAGRLDVLVNNADYG